MSLNKFLKSVGRDEVLLPALRKHLVSQEKLKQTGKLSRKDVTVADAKRTIRCFQNRIDEFNHGEEIKGEFFHPSALGQCLRKVYFDVRNAPQDTPVGNVTQRGDEFLRSHMTFETGTYIHVIVQNLCGEAGILVEREVAIQDSKRRILGHCDAHLKIKGVHYALEVKSINIAGFSKKTVPDHAHKAQVHAYMRSLDLHWAIILYVNKDTGLMKEFVIEFDSAFYEEAVKARIETFFSRLKRDVAPKREGDNPSMFPCRYCPYTRVCFETGYIERWQATLTAANKAKNH